MTANSPHTDISQEVAARRLARLAVCTLVVLWIEALLPPLIAIASLWMGLLGLVWLGLFQILPTLLQTSAPIFGLVLSFAFLWQQRHTTLPCLKDALLRLDRAQDMKTRPASSFTDRLVLNPHDPFAQQLWQAHQTHLADQILRLMPVWPQPALSLSDPYALRALALLLLATGFFAAGTERETRFWAALNLNLSSQEAIAWREDGWIDPPAYTHKPPIMLDLTQYKDGDEPAFTLPAGSVLVLRRSGGEALQATPSGTLLHLPADHQANRPDQDLRFKINGNGSLALTLLGHRTVRFLLTALPDTPPVVTLLSTPVQETADTLSLHYSWQDDYGIASGRIEITGVFATDHKTLYTPFLDQPPLGLTFLPDPRQGETKQRLNFETGLWSGLEVEARLKVFDDAPQTGTSDPFRFTIPQPVLTNPLARALDEQRKNLLRTPQNQKSVLHALDALMVAPDLFTPQFGVYLGLHRARQWLLRPADKTRLIETAQWLWDMAQMLEAGDLVDAQRALQAAQNALRDALEREASPQELQKLSEAVRQALNRLLQALADTMQKQDDDPSQSADADNGRTLTPQDLQSLMDKLDQALKRGDQAEAMRLMEQLRQITRNLQAARPNRRGSSGEQQALNDLQDMARDQQNLRDKTYREGLQRQQDRQRPQNERQTDPNGPLSDLQKNQQGLRDKLDALRNRMREKNMDQQGFGEAEGAMREAEGALGQGQESEALDAQNRVLQHLREGADQLAQQMQQQKQPGGDGETSENPPQNAGNGTDRDPLGRPLPPRQSNDRSRMYESDHKSAAEERARALLEELRRRLGEVARPQAEIDYLMRLLQSETAPFKP